MKRIDQAMKKLLTSDSKTLIRTAMDSQSSQQRSIARGLMFMDGGKWDESKHPRRKDGKFGRGMGSSASSSGGGSSGKSGSSGTAKTIKPGEHKYPRRAEKGASIDETIRAARITRLGENSMASKVAGSDSGKRFADKTEFAQGSAFGNAPIGKPTKSLPKGTGATRLSTGDLKDPDYRHTVSQYLDDEGRLTPEREELHRQAVDNLFAGKKPKGTGEPKVFTMLGGGAAAGKGALTRPGEAEYFGTPDKNQCVTIDPDELKKDIPEYREQQNTDPDNAAAFAHEESSAMAKRAMEAAMANGYDYTLDGTGDGSEESVLKKINQARENGYKVNACYVTCPTELAVERSLERAKRTKRNVPIDRLKKIHAAVSQIFPKVAPEFDHVTLYDTNQPRGQKPKLIAECYRGQKIKVYDQKLYDDFLKKGQ